MYENDDVEAVFSAVDDHEALLEAEDNRERRMSFANDLLRIRRLDTYDAGTWDRQKPFADDLGLGTWGPGGYHNEY